MAKIVGIDLGTTYSAVSIWDEKKKEPIIIPNLSGFYTTPSIVSLNKAGEVIVGEEARRNLWAAPQDTVSEIKREMGNDFKVMMRGKEYNPQTVSAFILAYLKKCAEQYFGETVHDVVITVPAYFKEVQKSATKAAGEIAGFNVHRLINEPTAAAIAYGVTKGVEGKKTYAVYDLGGGTFDVSIIQITPEDVTVVGTGGDMRLGGLDMDEAVMKWALREIKTNDGIDLSGDETVKRRLKVEAEGIKKALVNSENTTLNVPYLTMMNGQPYNVELPITRARFEMLIAPLLQRSLSCLEEAMARAKQENQVEWEDLDGILLVGGPTRLGKIRSMLKEKLLEHCPNKEPVVKFDLNPDEVVAMGAAIVAAPLPPIGKPPAEVETMTQEQVEAAKEQHREAQKTEELPKVDIFDVTSHSLGIAVEGVRFHRIITANSPIPITQVQGPFTNAADLATELLVEVYQGEEDFVAANTRIGEVRIQNLDPLPRGQQVLEIKFALDVSDTLSTICKDLRTGKEYAGTFKFDGVQKMSGDEIRKKREELAKMMQGAAPAQAPHPATPVSAPPVPPVGSEIPAITLEQIPPNSRVFWQQAVSTLPRLDAAKQAPLKNSMARFANAVLGGDPNQIQDAEYFLQDALVEVATTDESLWKELSAEVPVSKLDRVHFSVTSPAIVQPGQPFLVNIWAHLEAQRQIVMQRASEAEPTRKLAVHTKGPVTVARGTVLSVMLAIEGLEIDDPQDTILWDGDVGNAEFAVRVPENARLGTRIAQARIYANGLQIARMYFTLEVGTQTSKVIDHSPNVEHYRKAFASYSSADRDQVLARVQGMVKAMPQLDIFLDVLSLRSGQNWQVELEKMIPASDVFYLFWSENARKSEWVSKEWHCALATRGLDFIDPVPLQPPELVPPPEELAGKHFNDWVLAFMRTN